MIPEVSHIQITNGARPIVKNQVDSTADPVQYS